MKLSKGWLAIVVSLLVLSADQLLKIWIKTTFFLGEDQKVTDWFHIQFVENNGMAMGIEIGGKLFLSLSRILASIAVIYYLCLLIKKDFPSGYIACVAMIAAGAVGNIIDCLLYGVIFSESTHYTVAALFPIEGSYGTWLHGKVVDMFYFPLFKFRWPAWIPFVGGDEFVFFRYIFNLADAFINIGIFLLLLFYRSIFSVSFGRQVNGEK